MFEDNNNQEQSQQVEEKPTKQENASETKTVDQILAEMEVEAKVAQLMTYPVAVSANQTQSEANEATLSAAVEETGAKVMTGQSKQEIQELQPGLFIFFGSGIGSDRVQTVIQETNQLYNQDSLPPLFAVDHEGGQVQRFSGEGFSQLPAWQIMCSRSSEERSELFAQSAQELSQVGVNIVFAPVVDLGGSWLGTRSCKNYENLQPTAADFIEAFGQHQIMPVIKHFPGIGAAPADPHQTTSSINLDGEDVNIFKDLLDAYPNIGVMTAHIQIRDQFDEMPCSLSSRCLYALDEYWPESLVFTDALEMGALEVYAQQTIEASPSAQIKIETSDADSYLPSLAVQAIKAGNNVLVFGKDVSFEDLLDIRETLVQEYNNNPEFKKQVDYSLQKILAIKQINHE
jgi:beta-glucosidase-like glycosyl hydrolase